MHPASRHAPAAPPPPPAPCSPGQSFWVRAVQRLAMPGLALGLLATLGTLVWSDLQPLPDQGPRDRASMAARTPAGRSPPALPRGMAELGQTSSALSDGPELLDGSEDDGAEALLAEVEQLIRQADALDATLRQMQQGAMPWPDPEVPPAVGPEASAEFALAAPAPEPEPGESPPESRMAMAVPRPEAPVAPPAEADVALAMPGPAGQAAALPSGPPVRSQAPAAPKRPAGHAYVSAPMQQRCQFIIVRAQLGEEPSHADRNFLRTGCR